MKPTGKKTIQDCFLYALTPPNLEAGTVSWLRLRESIEQGIDALQLRLSGKSDRQILDLGWQIRQLTQEAGVVMIVNDRLDLCQILDADGLHLGQDDIPLKEARKILGPDKIIGLSTHTLRQAYEAEAEGADYLGYGPCYPSLTKENLSPRVSLEDISKLSQTLKIPFFVIGGLCLENLSPILAAGASRVAISAGIYSSSDVRLTIQGIQKLLLNHRESR